MTDGDPHEAPQRDETPQRDTAQPDTRPLLVRIDRWLLIPLSILVVAAITYLAAPQAAITQGDTAASTGTVLRIEAQVRVNLKSPPSCLITYTINGSKPPIEGTTVTASPSQCDYKIGDPIALRHPANDPTQAVLADASDRSHLILLGGGALAAVAALAVTVLGAGFKRRRTPQPPTS